MAVKFKKIDNEYVSLAWHVFLSKAREDNVFFRITEGHRTMARQQYFWNCYECQCCNGGNLAAYPSSNAPHIRTGRLDHAIDVAPGSDALINYGRKYGVTLRRTVVGEAWHLEASVSDLTGFARKHNRPSPVRKLGRVRRKSAERLLYHRREREDQERSGKGPKWRRQNRYVKVWSRVVRAQWRRAKGVQKDVLAQVIKDRDGRL